MASVTRFVGLDVHQDTIVIAVADAGREAPKVIGTVPHEAGAIKKALGKLGAGAQALDEDGTPLQQRVLRRRRHAGKQVLHTEVHLLWHIHARRRLLELPANILGGELHRHDTAFIPGTFLALDYPVGFIKDIFHSYLPYGLSATIEFTSLQSISAWFLKAPIAISLIIPLLSMK